ncbi:hypothetical protein EV421DRAFT_1743217 [Armillaria borealis]|uniref:Uncharacterized protein n=1 Tax=Armillaria borealis TaxID=47425 RepID=A0AA39MEZ9_9AGAR|nr:hypothetical protein EV421DRAFT_1743217 [Armillaria borealis]
MSDPYYLLPATLKKAPALWDTEVYDSLSNQQIAEQIEGAHTLLTTYRSAFNRPYLDFIECFLATALQAVHELPNWFVKPHWSIWVYGPDSVKEFLKDGPFTTSDVKLLKTPAVTPAAPVPLKKRKIHDPSPPVPSSQAGSSKAGAPLKEEKPACKWSKQDQALTTSTTKTGSSAALSKKSSSKDKGRAASLPITKESSTARDKTPGKPRGRKLLVEVPTVPRKKEVTPPPAILSENTHVDIRGRSPTPVTADLTSPSPGCGRLYHVCWPPVLTVIAGVTAPVGYPLMTCRRLLILAFSSVEGSHNTDAMLKFAHKYTVGHRLMIDMELITDKDGLLQKVFDLQMKHYYPCPLHLHSEMTPEPPLPEFAVLPDKKKQPSDKLETKDGDEEHADDDQVAKSLVDQLQSSPAQSSWVGCKLHLNKLAGVYEEFTAFQGNLTRYGEIPESLMLPAYPNPLALDMGIPPKQFRSLLVTDHYILLRQARTSHPSLVDMNTLATYLQPEIKSMLDSIHPFLLTHSQAAHEAYFPKDVNLVVIRFLATLTALANNLSLAFQSISWDAWKVEDSTRMFKLLGYSKPSFDPTDIFPGEVCLHWEHFQGAASATWFANLACLQISCQDALSLAGLSQADHYLLLRLARTRYPQILDFNILVYWCQPDVATLINHVHPFLNFMSPFPHDLHFPDSQDPVILSDLSPALTAIPYVGIGCYPIDLDKLPSAIADALRLVSSFLSAGYLLLT